MFSSHLVTFATSSASPGPCFQLVNQIFYTCSICLQVSERLDKIYTGYALYKLECGCFWHSRAGNSKVNSPILPAFNLVQDFMPVQIICNFHKDPMKTKQAMIRTWSNMGVFGTKGQVIPNSIADLVGIQTCPRFCACPDDLQVS